MNKEVKAYIIFFNLSICLKKSPLRIIMNATERENKLVLYFRSLLYLSGKNKNFLDKKFL